MKALFLVLLLAPVAVFAQKVNVSDVDANGDDESTTTIQVTKSKGKKTNDQPDQKTGEPTTGNATIEGEEALLLKDAKANWKKACDDWKKELKAEYKKVVADCGEKSCTTEASGKTCTSKGNYKIISQ